jgi:ubiquitin-protein ligase
MPKSPQQIRRERLESDYEEMCNIRGTLVQWVAEGGAPPHVERYRLTVRVRTIIGPAPTYRDVHELQLALPPSYPNGPPEITMLTRPQPFHVNWFASGKWCFGSWDKVEPLARHVLRMIRTLQFDSAITNVASPANQEAGAWYSANLRRGLFPTDGQELPDPTKRRLEIIPGKKRFEIL